MATTKTMGPKKRKSGTPATTKTAGASGGGTGPGATGMTAAAKPGALIAAALQAYAPNIKACIRGFLKLTPEERTVWVTARNAAIGAEKREAALAAKAAAAA